MATKWGGLFKDKKPSNDVNIREESRRPVESDELVVESVIRNAKEPEMPLRADHGIQRKEYGDLEDIPEIKPASRGNGFDRRRVSSEKASRTNTKFSERTALIGIVLDGTYSFSKVYPRVCMVLKFFLSNMKKTRENCKNVTIKYSLTVLHDEVDSVEFSDGSLFTESEDEVKNYLDNMEFFGGSETGKEPLNEAINHQLFILNTADNADDVKHVIKGLLLFTDSLPNDDQLTPSFTSAEPGAYGDYTNYGLRFADFYSFSSDYMPKMRIVDGNGKLTENGRNVGAYHDIHVLINHKPSDIVQYMDKMVNTHLGQLSMFP